MARFRVCWRASSIMKSDVCDEEKEQAEKGQGRKSMDGGKNDQKSHFEIREPRGQDIAERKNNHGRLSKSSVSGRDPGGIFVVPTFFPGIRVGNGILVVPSAEVRVGGE